MSLCAFTASDSNLKVMDRNFMHRMGITKQKKNRRNPVDTDSWNRLQYWLIASHFGWDSQDAVFKTETLWLRETTPKENPGSPVWGLGVRPAIAWGIFTKLSETFLSRYTHCITTTRSIEYISQRKCPLPPVCDSKHMTERPSHAPILIRRGRFWRYLFRTASSYCPYARRHD